MRKNKSIEEKATVYTSHGIKKKLGMWAEVNGRLAFAYVREKNDRTEILGYTSIDELQHQVHSCEIPRFELDI